MLKIILIVALVALFIYLLYVGFSYYKTCVDLNECKDDDDSSFSKLADSIEESTGIIKYKNSFLSLILIVELAIIVAIIVVAMFM